MNFRMGPCAAIGLLSASLVSPASAQSLQVGSRIIPQSSREFPGDRGAKVHTHVQILANSLRAGGFHIDGGLGPAGGMSPAQLRTIYSLPATGGSQIIAIVDAYDNPNALKDFNTFSTQFGLPTETSTTATSSTNKAFQVLYAAGTKPAVDSSGGWELEEALDIEWAHAMAPNAKILLVEAASTSYSDLLNAVDVATSYIDGNSLKVKEVSASWGGGEFAGETSLDVHFTGTTAVYFVSAGDSGAPAEYPSASAYVISAGGTSVGTNSSGVFTSESAWASGGGGPSSQESRPAFQNSVQSVVGAVRGTPDVSFDADPNTGAAVYDSYPYSGVTYGWIVVGGTSLSSPALAGVANLAATGQGAFPAGSNALAANLYARLGSSALRDITSGNNGYGAAAGWDFTTGVGSPIGLTAFQTANPNAPTTTSLSPNSATAGRAAFTLTVNGTNFVNGSVVKWAGSGLTTSFITASQLTASVPAANIASAGSTQIGVTNPDGSTSNTLTFTVISNNNPVPLISYISPTSVRRGSATFTLTVGGSKFIAASIVYLSLGGRSYALATSYISPTLLNAIVPSSLLTKTGNASVFVFNPAPGGGTSGAKSLKIN